MNSEPNTPHRVVFPFGLSFGLLLFLLCAAPLPLRAQSADFNAGNDSGWQHYTLPDMPAFGYYGAATYSFPDDGAGGKAYRIYTPPITNDVIGARNARAGSFRTDAVYTDRFSVGADLLAWNAAWRQEAGLILLFSDIGLGTSEGYTATYSSAYRQLYINLVVNEDNAYTVAELGTGAVTLDPAHRYRLVASTHNGYLLLLQLFDKAEPDNPCASAIGTDYSYYTVGGVCGLFVYQQDPPPSASGADATFDNYVATRPAAGAMPATVTDLSPFPASGATAFYPTVTVGILDRDTMVDTTSIALAMDGVWIPNGSLTIDSMVHRLENPAMSGQDFPGATVSYPITTLLPWGSRHTNSVAFRDSTSTWRTNTWTWTTAYPLLAASNALPLGSFTLRGWDLRMVQTNGPDLGNTLLRAEQQLAIPPTIPWEVTTQTVVQVFNSNDAGDGTTATDFGFFPGAAPVPGLSPDGSHNNIAMEMFAYLELTEGVHRFGAVSDDGFRLASGAGPRDPNATILGFRDGGTFNSTFDFAVEATGLYPVRCVWYENGGGANFQLFSVDLNNPEARVLLNDPANPAQVVKAYQPIRVVSSETIDGAYTTPAGAVIDTSARTVTVPKSGAARFYRIQTLNPVTITRIRIEGNNVLLDYR